MKPDLMKIQALQDLPTPENHEQLQSFLGLIFLFTALSPQRVGFQDHIFKGTNFALGLESFHRCYISKT